MHEPELFKHFLNKINDDWINSKGSNFSKIAKDGFNSYTYINDIFRHIRAISKKEKITQEDYEKIKEELEKQISLYSDISRKKEIYIQAVKKIDRIKDRFEKDKKFTLEDVGCDLLCNFEIGLGNTPFYGDKTLTKIGDIGSNLEWGNANERDWIRIIGNIRNRLVTEAGGIGLEEFQNINNLNHFISEKEFLKSLLYEIKKDWQTHHGENFSKIANIVRERYIYDDYYFYRLKDISKSNPINEKDYEIIIAEIENQIEQYSTKKSKKYIYKQALDRLDKIIRLADSKSDYSLDNIKDKLYFNFIIAYLDTPYELDLTLYLIGNFMYKAENNEELKDKWKYVKTTLRNNLIEEIEKAEKESTCQKRTHF